MRLMIVRHGPTHLKSMVGWSDVDVDLSDNNQIQGLARALPQSATMVSSDLKRAVQTADAIQTTQKRLDHNAELREMNFGDWELKTFAEVNETSPDLIRAFYETPGDIAPPNGESWIGFSDRIHDTLDQLVKASQHENVIVVAHYGVVIAAIQRALNIPAYEAFSYPVNNLSLTDISIRDNQWNLNSQNITF